DYVQIENVVEFMSWGPMRVVCKKKHKADPKNGVYANSEIKYIINKKTGLEELAFTPIAKKNGQDFRKWESHINTIGYRSDWRELNSADFGAYTSRNRLFGCFAKKGLPIVWPEPTHSKNGGKKETLFGDGLKKWNAVKDLLDFEDEGVSIFGRKNPLVENSLKRIYAGLIKQVAGGKDSFLIQYNGGENRFVDVDKPCNTLTLENRFALTQTHFLTAYYGNEKGSISVNDTLRVIPTRDTFSLHSIFWLDKQYSGERNHQSVNQPAGSILSNDKHCLMTAKGFIYN